MDDDEVLVEDLREPDRDRRRKSDVQGKFYNFLNRSAQSLTRSNSQSGRSRRAKEKDKDKENKAAGSGADDAGRVSPRAPHAASSRLTPGLGSGNAPETSTSGTSTGTQSRLLSSSARTSTSRSVASSSGNGIAATPTGERELPPRKSSSPPLTPPGQHKHSLSIPSRSRTPVSAYTYNTPPQTPARSRKYSNPSSPSSITGGRDLLLNRPLARPITPSNSTSTSGKKLFGIPLPSPTHRKAALILSEVEEEETRGSSPKRLGHGHGHGHSGHKLRSGSGSSHEPLLHDRIPSNDSGRTGSVSVSTNHHGVPRPSTSAITPRPNNNNNIIRTSGDKSATTTPLPTPSSSLPRSTRSAVSREERPPPSPTTTGSRRGTPRLDFWRSLTPRAPSAQGDREKDKGKQRATTPDASSEKQELVSPQPRAPAATFLPRFQRSPATPTRRGEGSEAAAPVNTVRLDSFMSDSLPIPQDAMKTPLAQVQVHGHDQALNGGSGLTTRQPAFTVQHDLPRSPRTPGAPERPKTAPALGPGIQRSNSTPGTRGRLSPCLRIPSPKFLTRERSRSKDPDRDKEKEKEKERGMNSNSEKRKVTLDSVGAPILREPRTYVHPHPHPHPHAYGHAHGPIGGGGGGANGGVSGEKGVGIGGLKAPKASLVQLRRAAHGTFDFERPGSRTSSKSGQSESRGTRSDDERDKDREKDREREREREREKENHTQNDKENDNEMGVRRRLFGMSSSRPPDLSVRTKGKAPSPVPPLPTPSSRVKTHSPPPTTFPRTRSPLGAYHAHTTTGSTTTHQHSHSHSQSHSHATHIDDSALPRLSSSSARRNSSSNQHFRTPGAGAGIYRPPTSLPHFSFEPAAPRVPSPPSVPPKPVRDAGGQYVDTRTGLIMYAPASPEPKTPKSRKSPKGPNVRLVDERTRKGGEGVGRRTPANVNGHATPTPNGIPPRELEEATAVITQFKSALDEAGFATLQKYVRRYDAKIIPLDGAAGLLARVQRLLDTSAPRVDERRKRQLYESFVRVVRVSQVS